MRRARIRLLLLCLGTLALVLPSLHVHPAAGRQVTGDCVTTPITEIAVSRVGLLQS
jgi:hypothetical protein